MLSTLVATKIKLARYIYSCINAQPRLQVYVLQNTKPLKFLKIPTMHYVLTIVGICSYCAWLMSVHVLFRILDTELSNDATIEVVRSSAAILILLR